MALLDQLRGYLPEVSGASIFRTVTWGVVVIIISVLVALALIYFIMRAKFKKKIIIFEKINGVVQQTGKDLGMDFRIGLGGDTVLLLKKRKKYLPTPRIQTGTRTYYYQITEDDEWINFGLADVDVKRKEMGVTFIDSDMRYARTALQRNLRERYEKRTFLEKYGGMIAYGSLILVTGIAGWLLADKFIAIVDKVAVQIDLANQLAQTQKEILGALDKVCSGSGLKPAG